MAKTWLSSLISKEPCRQPLLPIAVPISTMALTLSAEWIVELAGGRLGLPEPQAHA